MHTYQLITELNESQKNQLYRLYQQEWWTKHRQRQDVYEMLNNSDLIFALWSAEEAKLLAFARVLTDHLYRAYICDVIVDPAARGQGIGRGLMEAINQALKQVERVELICQPDKVDFYKKLGFQELQTTVYMRREEAT